MIVVTSLDAVFFIEEQLELQGISRNKFGQRTLYSPNSFSGWRDGTRAPRLVTMIDMLGHLGFDFHILPKGFEFLIVPKVEKLEEVEPA